MTQWNNMHRPCGLFIRYEPQQVVYIGELAPQQEINKEIPNLGARISIYEGNGKRIARLGDVRAGEAPNQFISPHSLAWIQRETSTLVRFPGERWVENYLPPGN